MLILAVDTSAIASAALVSDDAPAGAETPVAGNAGSSAVPRIVAAFATEDTRSHAEVLAPGINAMLAEAQVTSSDLHAIVVGVGPGPFTGLRSGIVTARTLSFVWKLPLHGMMSLDAVAWSVAGSADPGNVGFDGTFQGTGGEFLVATDARRKEVYWAKYRLADGTPELIDGPHVGPAAELPPLPVCGAGAGLYADVVNAVPEHTRTQPEAGALGSLALRRLAAGEPLRDTAPLYLRESDAKVPGPRKRALETEKR